MIFAFNYDVYIIKKNQEICKPIYITKRDMFSNLDNSEKNVYDIAIEKFKNLDIHENFESSSSNKKKKLSSNDLELSIIPHIKNNYKKIVIGNVINVLNHIPINLTNNIKLLLKYFAIIYQNSLSIDDFYKNITSNPVMNKYPFNSIHSNLIIFLIDQFDYINNNKNNKNNKDDANNEDNYDEDRNQDNNYEDSDDEDSDEEDNDNEDNDEDSDDEND